MVARRSCARSAPIGFADSHQSYRAGDVWHTDDGLMVRFLAPSEPHIADSGDAVDENSIVVMLEY